MLKLKNIVMRLRVVSVQA